ncbi:FMN-dependent NADH-azoreductase [Streptomyces triticirhizae]|uniref:FMN dependent NADH:quinone oxidoreductase n=1 Tax=Streptomyces triticirhizae TaxID=2483353 RepID=A0A3M2LH28_9ACTN|nr:NAD(P)H-dependent oxidoreductase [Streptomyces triticirhizae]RMI36817.1 FMN-dependent NADH-azoreductase [Streptomyces triticirhizae]
MATLLHIDSSLNGDASVSREVTRTFRESWQAAHPEGTVIHRDLNADPVPHLTAAGHLAPNLAPEERTEEQRAAYALRDALTSEFEAADAVVIGAPLYNYGVPSTLQAYLNQILIMGRTAGEQSTVAGKPVTVVTSRGGSYRPGTPRAGQDFNEPYLRHLLGTSMGLDVRFIVPELTLARMVPAMADLVELADTSRAEAHQEARAQAGALAARLVA